MSVAFFFIILAFPVLEIASLIEMGRFVGLLPTLLLLFLGGAVGLALIRGQSLNVGAKLLSAMREGRSPATHLADSGFLVFAGFLFMIPGFFSDAIALLLLLPPVRWALARHMGGHVHVWSARARNHGRGAGDKAFKDENVIDAEFTEVRGGRRSEEDSKARKPGESGKPSPWGQRR
jgi:UPF0716 protein FxsA